LLDGSGASKLVDRAVGAERLLLRAPGVYVLPGHPDCWEQRLWIGLLAAGPGVSVSHEAAAELHGLEGIVRGRLSYTGPHPIHHRVRGAVVHQITDVLPHHLTSIDSFPVTTVPRTVVDLAATLSPTRLRHVLEDTTHKRLATYADTGSVLREVARRGKPGVLKLARVLDALTSDRCVPTTQLERDLFALLTGAGEPLPVAQFPFPGRQVVRGCTDGAWEDAMLIVEADGRAWHTRIADIRRDRDRDNEAARAGWATLRFLYEHIVSDGPNVVGTIHETRVRRLELLRRAPFSRQ
jgi:hypothetical protein